jgi:hypothetical protein
MTTDIYGPNTIAVAAFIERLRTLTPEQADRLAAAWDAAADAAVALALRDLISPEHFALLVAPFVDTGLGEWVGIEGETPGEWRHLPQRRVRLRDSVPGDYCAVGDGPWPCDAERMRLRAEAAEAELRALAGDR